MPESDRQPPLVRIAWNRPDSPAGTASEPIAVAIYQEAIAAHSKAGSRIWSHRQSAIPMFSVAALSGRILTLSEDARSIQSIGPDGRVAWLVQESDAEIADFVLSADGGLAVVLFESGEVRAYDPEAKMLWSTFVDEALSLAVSNQAGLVGVGTAEGYVLIDAKGEVVWERQIERCSVILSAIWPEGDRMLIVGVPGCRLAILDRAGDIRFEDYRACLPKGISISPRAFAVGYGLDDSDFGTPSDEDLSVEVFTVPGQGEGQAESRRVIPARTYDLAPDGTLAVWSAEGRLEVWPTGGPDMGQDREPHWSQTMHRPVLALASRGGSGPIFVVGWDDYAVDLSFDYQRMEKQVSAGLPLRFCPKCGREYHNYEPVCSKCEMLLSDSGWCDQCGSYFRLAIGERCPVHGVQLKRRR
jgi:hypothetical protein